MTEADIDGVGAARPQPTGTQDHPSIAGDDERSFEELVDELERITDRLAGGELGIEAATDLYVQAEHVHELASARLAQVQERIDRLRAGRAAPPSGVTG
jgi:exodeoxyribonuclease VII small subunit